MTNAPAPDTGGPQRAETDTGPPRLPHRPPLSARAAATQLGVNERTVRRWIDQGQLAAVKVRGSYRIAVEEIERARVAVLGEGLGDVIEAPTRAGADTPGHARPAADTAAAAGAAPDTPAISPAARSQLEAIRDEWLRPLVERNEELARLLGRAEAEREAALAEVERLKTAQDAPVASPEPQHGAQPVDTPSDTSRSRWATWWRRLVGGGA